MRTTSALVVLSLLAVAGRARAEEAAPASAAATAPAANLNAAPTPVAAPARKLQIAAAFLPMGLGKYKYSQSDTETTTLDASFAYGISLSGSYEVLRGLLVGLAPQLIFNVQPKPNDTANPPPSRELDVLARVAYAVHPVETISFYAEALPGYSILLPSDNSGKSKGFVVGFGVGCTVDMTDRAFINVGGGYQVGFQTLESGVHQFELRTRYVRVALGGGVRF